MEVIDRATIEADLPGILRAYGWRAVRGEDAADRRVLTDSEGSRRIVVSRNSETQRWQWWDTAIMVVGTIVDAITQLLRFPSMREVLILLRNALIYPPGPLPVLAGVDQDEALNHISALSESEQLLRPEEKHYEESIRVLEPDQGVAGVISEQSVESGDEPAAHDAEIGGEQPLAGEETTEVHVPEGSIPEPPRRGGRGR